MTADDFWSVSARGRDDLSREWGKVGFESGRGAGGADEWWSEIRMVVLCFCLGVVEFGWIDYIFKKI